MGGTFDPIHHGHLVAASEVQAWFDLDEVVFVPTGDPWQKSNSDVSPAEHRGEAIADARHGCPFRELLDRRAGRQSCGLHRRGTVEHDHCEIVGGLAAVAGIGVGGSPQESPARTVKRRVEDPLGLEWSRKNVIALSPSVGFVDTVVGNNNLIVHQLLEQRFTWQSAQVSPQR